MNENQYNEATEKTFHEIEMLLDEAETDLDYSSPGTGILEIELADGRKIIINRHLPMQEVWLAASSGAHHFRWDGKVWRDTRTNAELFDEINRLIE